MAENFEHGKSEQMPTPEQLDEMDNAFHRNYVSRKMYDKLKTEHRSLRNKYFYLWTVTTTLITVFGQKGYAKFTGSGGGKCGSMSIRDATVTSLTIVLFLFVIFIIVTV